MSEGRVLIVIKDWSLGGENYQVREFSGHFLKVLGILVYFLMSGKYCSELGKWAGNCQRNLEATLVRFLPTVSVSVLCSSVAHFHASLVRIFLVNLTVIKISV